MLDLLLPLLTWTPSLVLSGGLGALGLIGPFFGAFKAWAMLARVVGLILLCVHCFLWGFRTADDRAAQNALVESLSTQVTSLTSQLANQAKIAADAAGERERLRRERNEVTRLAGEYKAQLAELETKVSTDPQVKTKAPTNACVIDDTDLRFSRSLRQRAKNRP